MELMADTRLREGETDHVISDNHVDLNTDLDVEIEPHVIEERVNHVKESTPSDTSVPSPKLDTPVANGIVVQNPEYTDTISKSSERSSGSLIRTDEDDVTLTIPVEGRGKSNSFTPVTYTSVSHVIPSNSSNNFYHKNRSQTLDSNYKYNKSVKTNIKETAPDRYLDESLNPFPAYYDEVPIENIPPPKPLRTSSTYNSRTLPPRAPKAPQFTARPRTQQTPGHLSLDRRNLNAQRPPPRRQDSSQNFESELKQAIARVKTRSSLGTKYTGPDFDRQRPRSFSPAITSFDDELKKALFARRQSMNNFDYLYDTEKKSPEFDLRLTKSSEPTIKSQEIKISEESAGSVISASTRDEGSESEFSVNGDSGIVAGGDSVRGRDGKSRPGLDLQAFGDQQHSLSESDLRVINEFSATMERLKRGMRKEDAVKLERSITSIHKIVGGDRSASENEREKAISE